MKADRHYWRTADGRHVTTGHVDAEILAYPAGDELPDDVARELGLLDPLDPLGPDPDPDPDPEIEVEEKPVTKRGGRPANKAGAKTPDK